MPEPILFSVWAVLSASFRLGYSWRITFPPGNLFDQRSDRQGPQTQRELTTFLLNNERRKTRKLMDPWKPIRAEIPKALQILQRGRDFVARSDKRVYP